MEIDHPQVALDEVDLQPHLESLLSLSSQRHRHICPRQILGVRIGLAGATALGMDVPRGDKRMMVIVETDGCFISGVEAATGCSVNRRTMRVVDFGRISATLINVKTEQAVRVTPQLDIRSRAFDYAPDQKRRYFAMLHGYQAMPDSELLTIQPVKLTIDLQSIISRPGVRTNCHACGEEIINEREIFLEGKALCRACAGESFYSPLSS